MDLEETKTIISLIVDSEGKLVGLLGDEDDEGCPIAFAPSADLVGALRVFPFKNEQGFYVSFRCLKHQPAFIAGARCEVVIHERWPRLPRGS